MTVELLFAAHESTANLLIKGYKGYIFASVLRVLCIFRKGSSRGRRVPMGLGYCIWANMSRMATKAKQTEESATP
jgi:hypothetical protein